MKKVIVFVFIFLFSVNVYAAEPSNDLLLSVDVYPANFSSDPSDFAEVVNTTWKFTIGLKTYDHITIQFYDNFYQDPNEIYLSCSSINNIFSDQIGVIYYGDFITKSGQGFICFLTHPSGYTDWLEIYEFKINNGFAIGTFCNLYDDDFSSPKWLTGSKIKDSNILGNPNLPYAPDNIYNSNSDKKNDGDNMFGCFISSL